MFGRSPCGERGLKSIEKAYPLIRLVSLPLRGAWIEILLKLLGFDDPESLPLRGAWIEIRTA